MELALVRHGQTDYNRDDLMQGTSDIPLNETGIAQAHEAARLLADAERSGTVQWDAVVSSALQRSMVTADIIAAALGLDVAAHYPSLNERAYGQAEGLTAEQAKERFGTDWPGQESYEALQRRAVPAIDEIAAAHPVGALVIVGHGTFIRAFADHVVGFPTVKPDNARSVRFAGLPGSWRVTEGLVRA